MNDPYVLIDAWSFDGFSYEHRDRVRRGLSGTNIRVITGEVIVESSWGVLHLFDGDKILIVDVAACVALNRSNRRILALGPMDAFTTVLLHELSHWAEENYRPDSDHSKIWNPFLASIIMRTKERLGFFDTMKQCFRKMGVQV
ncbi:hypothetical protein ES703_17058 [subsurface metagenome]